MKVRFFIDSGANIRSCNESEWIDPADDWGLDPGEWENMSEDEKYKAAAEYWQEQGQPEIYFEEQKEDGE